MTTTKMGTLFGQLDEDFRRRAHEWAERTATEQGLPPKLEDVVVIRRVLILIGVLDANGNRVKPLR